LESGGIDTGALCACGRISSAGFFLCYGARVFPLRNAGSPRGQPTLEEIFMHTVQWTIFVRNLPLIMKSCPRCGCERYENSGRFRVNANGGKLDVWVVFRCAACKSTWNMRVYDRVDCACLPRNEYSALMQNDPLHMRRIAFDRATLLRSHVSIDFGSADLQIDGFDIPSGEAADVTLVSEYYLDLPVCAVIAKKLGVSNSRVKRLESNGSLVVDGGMKKRKTGFGFHFALGSGWSPD